MAARPGNLTSWASYAGKEKNTDTTSLFFRYDYFDESRGFAKGQVGWYMSA